MMLAVAWPASMLGHPFMRNAYAGGTAVAVVCGLTGYFLVLRAQVFTVDALSHVAFTGALGALAFGGDLRAGLFVATIAVAAGMGLLGRSGRADDVIIGSVFVWMLGIGVLFLKIYTASRSGIGGATGAAGVGVLFGSVFGLSGGDVLLLLVAGAGVLAAFVAGGRPLLFATVDPPVAAARGVPVRGLGIAFLVTVGVAAGASTMTIGALPLLGLLAAPGAAAVRLTTRPSRGIALAILFAVASTWIGLAAAYELHRVPPSTAIVAVAAAIHAGAHLVPAHGRSPAARPVATVA
jgi:zinc/manganese transport system permease protein